MKLQLKSFIDGIKDFFKNLFDGRDKEKVDASWFLAAKSNNGNDKDNNGNNGKHKGWYKRADHPKNPGDLDPLDDVGTYEIINYVNDVSLENAQVLMTSDENGNYTNAYTYGIDRISVDNLSVENGVKTDPRYYLYNGRGSTSNVINVQQRLRGKMFVCISRCLLNYVYVN